MRRMTFIASVALAASLASAAAALPSQPKIHPAGIPKDAVMISPCIQRMGEHWANRKNLPTGPIYGTWHDKPVFTEIVVSVKQLQDGFNWLNIRALPGYTIDHVDFEFEPHGHAGFAVPDYNIHAYYVSPAVQATICPNGKRRASTTVKES
ncbi:MAG: hypothetical protein JO322_01285 [Candidatus Eremiobacteraeota bacterium]|nr:hypothetical protein [Candidatus Eremiobacteraeota bacterium]